MFHVEIDVPRNVLLLSFTEIFDCREGEQLCAQLRGKIALLNPGFRVINDLSRLDCMEFEAHRSIDEVMEICNRYGVAKVIRVIARENHDIGFTIMSRFHYSPNVVIHTCYSLEEAEQFLT
ncbi:MAG: hypothetical protein PHO30_01515 [Candidatus Omnitrophica bacterium]|jgi:hypothetical protein|nr:hypothetical protein [Candidatus Omnitrophota bacterium]